jgi:hypothetical protein
MALYIGGMLIITHVFVVQNFEVMSDTLNDDEILLLKDT